MQKNWMYLYWTDYKKNLEWFFLNGFYSLFFYISVVLIWLHLNSNYFDKYKMCVWDGSESKITYKSHNVWFYTAFGNSSEKGFCPFSLRACEKQPKKTTNLFTIRRNALRIGNRWIQMNGVNSLYCYITKCHLYHMLSFSPISVWYSPC